jgi:hypothetical protein
MTAIDSQPTHPASASDRPVDRRAPSLVCPACGRTEPRPADALRRLAEGRWLECCGRVMVPALAVVPAPAVDPTPWADRRMSDRRRPRPGTRVDVRRGGLGLGPNIALELVDVSAGGAKVLVRGHVRRGDRVVVGVRPPTKGWEVRTQSEVCWCLVAKDGTALVGVRFQRPLTLGEVDELTD